MPKRTKYLKQMEEALKLLGEADHALFEACQLFPRIHPLSYDEEGKPKLDADTEEAEAARINQAFYQFRVAMAPIEHKLKVRLGKIFDKDPDSVNF